MSDLSLKATIKFNSRIEADVFAKQFSRKTLLGYIVGSEKDNVCEVIIDIKSDEAKDWVDQYIQNLNDQNSLDTKATHI